MSPNMDFFQNGTRKLEESHWGEDFPFPLDKDDLSPGIVILFIIALLYTYGAIYIIYTKYLFPSLEDVTKAFEKSHYKHYLTFLSSIPFLLIMLYSCFISKDNIGIATVVGSDAINLLLLLGLIQIKVIEAYDVEAWEFTKDSFFYTINLIILAVSYAKPEMDWPFALGWILFFMVYAAFFQVSEGWLKEKFYDIFGVESDKDGFSCEEMKNWEKKRFSVTELIDEGYLTEHTEQNVKFRFADIKIRKMEQEEPSKALNYHRWRIPAFKIIHAIRKRNLYLKDQRGAVLHSKQSEKMKQPQQHFQHKPSSPTNSQKHLLRLPSNESNSAYPVSPTLSNSSIKKFTYPIIHEENHKVEMGSIFDTDGKTLINPNDVQDELDKEIREEEDIEDHEESFEKHEKDEKVSFKTQAVHYDDDMMNLGKSINIPNPTHHDTSFEDDDDYSLSIPYRAKEKIRFILFFPIHFIIFFMLPGFRRQVNPRKSLISSGFILFMLGGALFLAMSFLEVIAYAFNIDIEILGLTINSIAICLGRVIYLVYRQNAFRGESFISILQTISLYRYGFGGGVAWILYAIFKGDSFPKNKEGFLYSIILLAVLLIVSFFIIGCNRMTVSKHMRIYYLIGYVVFFIASIIFMIDFNTNL